MSIYNCVLVVHDSSNQPFFYIKYMYIIETIQNSRYKILGVIKHLMNYCCIKLIILSCADPEGGDRGSGPLLEFENFT